MVDARLAVVGYGMATSLGDATTACAAARAGVSRSAPLGFGVEDRVALEMVPVLGHELKGGLARGFSEIGRAVRLASLALRDVFARTAIAKNALPHMPFIVNLGSSFYLTSLERLRAKSGEAGHHEGQSPRERFEALRPLYDTIIPKSLKALGMAPEGCREVRLLFADQCGFSDALSVAHELLSSSAASACLVGAIDSLVEPLWLRACDELRLLKTPLRPVGFMPGEAAAFLLVVRADQRVADTAAGVIVHSASALEAAGRFSQTTPAGAILSKLARDGWLASGKQDLGLISDLNGDAVRAMEFGNVLVRLRPDLEPLETLYPALAFGETRAAAGFLGACMALHGFTRGGLSSANQLVLTANDDGRRAATLMRKNTAQPARGMRA